MRVNGFTKSLVSKIVPIVDATVAYECEFSGKVYLLIVRNTLYVEEIEMNLIAPFIMRLAGITVNEEPKFMVTNPTIHQYSVHIPEKDVIFPLVITGIISYLPTRMPTEDEVNMDEA